MEEDWGGDVSHKGEEVSNGTLTSLLESRPQPLLDVWKHMKAPPRNKQGW